MVTIRGVVIAVQLKGGSQKDIHHQGYDAGGVGLEGQLRHCQHELEFLKKEFLVLNVRRGWLRSRGFWTHFPLARGLQPILNFTDRGEVLIEPRFIIAAKSAAEAFGLIEQSIEDAAALLKPVELSLHGSLVALHEHLLEQGRCAVFGGEKHTITRPGETAVGLVNIYAKV